MRVRKKSCYQRKKVVLSKKESRVTKERKSCYQRKKVVLPKKESRVTKERKLPRSIVFMRFPGKYDSLQVYKSNNNI